MDRVRDWQNSEITWFKLVGPTFLVSGGGGYVQYL